MLKFIGANTFAALAMLGSLAGGAQPAAASLFCDLCTIQGCSCTGSQCTNCGASFQATPGRGQSSGNTSAAIAIKRNQEATRKVCLEVQGKYIKTHCRDIKKKTR